MIPRVSDSFYSAHQKTCHGLALEDLEDLLADIEVYVKIDLNKNKDFWSDIVTIVQDELSKLRKMERVSVLRQNFEITADITII